MKGRSFNSGLIVGAAALMFSMAATAQVPSPPPQPLDPAVEDTGPLSTSLRDMRVDLRVPTGFEQVYHVPGRDDLLMRTSGALHAVFPRSVYAHTRHGLLSLVPAGTVFHIGSVPQPPDDSPLPDIPGLRVNTRVIEEGEPLEAGVAEAGPAGSAVISPRMVESEVEPDVESAVEFGEHGAGPWQTATIVNNARYRQTRLAELLDRAAKAEADK